MGRRDGASWGAGEFCRWLWGEKHWWPWQDGRQGPDLTLWVQGLGNPESHGRRVWGMDWGQGDKKRGFGDLGEGLDWREGVWDCGDLSLGLVWERMGVGLPWK